MFVPSGWHHQVWNLEDTISVNHNWFNGCNIESVWNALSNSLRDVKREIDDCRDMDDFESHCQLMLRSLFGMNFESLLEIFECISKNRFSILANISEKKILVNGVRIGKQHALYDLKAMKNVLNQMNEVELSENMKISATNLLIKINELINENLL